MNSRAHSGFSLIELMIGLTIGLLLLGGLTLLFVNTSESNREMQKTAQQIENGRYAVDILSQDLRVAGFYGHLHDVGSIATPASVPPDPCEASDPAELLKALWYPIQAYGGTIHASNPASDTAPDISSTSCGGLLTAANLKPGSDVIVIRRADTNALAATDTAVSNVFYLQASAINAEVQVGNGAAIGTNKADGNASVLFLTNGASPAPAAPIRRLHVHIYFVAPCSSGTGANGICTASDDTIPTLKRIELTASGSLTIVPLVEGIDYLKADYGVDNVPNTVNLATGSKGDGTADSFSATPADWTTVISARLYVLARNTDLTRGYTDDKTYTLGSISVPARNDSYKRHVYTAAVHLINPAGRREIP